MDALGAVTSFKFMRTCITICLFLFCFRSGAKAQIDSVLTLNMPSWALEAYTSNPIMANYELINKVNPFYLEEDFNGDDKVDIVVWVKNKLSKQHGIAILHRGDNDLYIVGAGKDFGMGSDMSWSNRWFVYRDEWVYNFNDKKKKFMLPLPGIEIVQNEKTSAVIYWDKRHYTSYIKHI